MIQGEGNNFYKKRGVERKKEDVFPLKVREIETIPGRLEPGQRKGRTLGNKGEDRESVCLCGRGEGQEF